MEIWKEIAGSYGPYEVSSEGRLRRGGRVLRSVFHKNGYEQVVLCHNAKPKTHWVHRLVAVTFSGPIPDGKEVNHKDGNRANNRAENLEYVTRAENNLHAYRVLGRKPPRAKLTPDDVSDIRRLSELGATRSALGKKYGVHPNTIGKIALNHRWIINERSSK